MASHLKTVKKNWALLFRAFGTKSTVQPNLTYFLSLFLADGIPVSVSIMPPDHPLFLQPFYLIFLNYLFNNAYWHWYYYFHCLLIILIITSTSLYVFNDMYAWIKGSKSVIYWFTEVMVLIIFGIFLLNPCRFDTSFF